MSAAVLLACGCERAFNGTDVPICPAHGPQRITRTVRMPAPRIRGVATGPHVIPEDLAPWVGRIVGSEE